MYLANNKGGTVRCYKVEDIEVVWEGPEQQCFGSPFIPQKKQLKQPRRWSFKMLDGSPARACVERTRAAAIAGVMA